MYACTLELVYCVLRLDNIAFSSDSPTQLFRNDGGKASPKFTDVAKPLGIDKGTREGRGLLAFDYDGDGDQ